MPPSSLDRYRILRKLATGGMAEIFLARQTGLEGLERSVVIKRILPHRARDAEFVTMFLDEARIVAGLNHPNVAQIYDLGKEEDTYFLVMEYVRGPDLGKILDTIYESGGRGLPLRIGLPIMVGVCEALHYIHEKRDDNGIPLAIVHRDINPQNVVISYEGAVKLIDFGIAKAKTKVYETRTGVIKGTYGYMAPEQLTRKAPIDRRSDVFALGVLLYESILGVHPFDAADEVSMLGHIVRGEYRRPRTVRADFPEELERIVMGCLTPRPEQRTPDARTVQHHLEEFMAANRLVPSMARLGDFIREVIPEAAEKRDEPRPVSRPRAPAEPPPAPARKISYHGADDSVIAALAGPAPRLDAPLRPEDFEATELAAPPRVEARRPPSERRSVPPPVVAVAPTVPGYPTPAMATDPRLGSSDSTPALQPLLEPSVAAPLPSSPPANPKRLTRSSPSTEDSVSIATVKGKLSPMSGITMPPVSNIDRLPAGQPLPVPGPWTSATVRGVLLVTLAALGGAAMAAIAVAVVSRPDDEAPVQQPERPAPGKVAEHSTTPRASTPGAPIVPPATATTEPAGATTTSIALPPPAAVTPPVAPGSPATAAVRKTLHIRSSPGGAGIWINGIRQASNTPATLELPADAPEFVTVRVGLRGFHSLEREVEVITGTAVFELQRQRGPRRAATTKRRRSPRR